LRKVAGKSLTTKPPKMSKTWDGNKFIYLLGEYGLNHNLPAVETSLLPPYLVPIAATMTIRMVTGQWLQLLGNQRLI
jgi:hypothetical protein